jgi:hypothetical protein
MRFHIRKKELVIQKGMLVKPWLVLFVIAFYCCAAFGAPDNNPAPSDQIKFIGTLPDDINSVLVEDWYTTTDSIFCKHMVGEAGFLPNHFAKRAELVSASDAQRSWTVWRDEVKPGHCGWALKQVVLYLDSKSSGIDPVRASNIPTRVAYVCDKGENCQNTPALNDDSEKPTYHRCSFALLRQLAPTESRNPCVLFSERGRRAGVEKSEHILRPGQRIVRFVITEVEVKNE